MFCASVDRRSRALGLAIAALLLLGPAISLGAIDPDVIAALRAQRVLVMGGTGNNGSVIVRQFAALKIPFRAMSRDAVAARKDLGLPGVEWVQGNVTDAASLAAPLKGIDVVIDAVAATGVFGDSRPEAVDFEGMRNLVAAAKAAGVKRIVIITSSVSGKKDHFLNVIGRDVLIWKGRAEELLVASGLEYVIVGPAGIDDEPIGARPLRVIPRSSYVAGMKTSRADLAVGVLTFAVDPRARNRAFTLINDAAGARQDWRAALAAMPAK